MKKLILGILFLTSLSAFSQTTSTSTATNTETNGFNGILSHLEFGIKAGANVSNFNNFNLPTDPLIGYHGGLMIAYKFSEHFMVQEDFLYSLQGAKLKSGFLGAQDVKLSYLQVPITFKYRTSSGFFGEVGAQTGFLLKEEIAGFNTGQKFAKKIDAAAIGGIGYQSKMGLGIGARYVYGFTNVSDTPSAVLGDFKNSTIQASIFYVF